MKNQTSAQITLSLLLATLGACGDTRTGNPELLPRPSGPVAEATSSLMTALSPVQIDLFSSTRIARPFFTSTAAAYEYAGDSLYAANALGRAKEGFGRVIDADKSVCMVNALQASGSVGQLYDGKVRKLTWGAATFGYIKGSLDGGVVKRMDYYSCQQATSEGAPTVSLRNHLRASREGDTQTYEFVERQGYSSDPTEDLETYSLISGSVSGQQWQNKRIQELEYLQAANPPDFYGDTQQLAAALLMKSWSGYQEGNLVVELSGSVLGNADNAYRIGAGIHVSVDGLTRNRWDESGNSISTEPAVARLLDGVSNVTEAEVNAVDAKRDVLTNDLPTCGGEDETIEIGDLKQDLIDEISACSFDK